MKNKLARRASFEVARFLCFRASEVVNKCRTPFLGRRNWPFFVVTTA